MQSARRVCTSRGAQSFVWQGGCRPDGIAAAVLTSRARRSARLSVLTAWPWAPSIASRLNTALGEDESGDSDAHAAGFDAMWVRAADVALAAGGSLTALACGPARDRSPRDELARILTMVGVAPRISNWLVRTVMDVWLRGGIEFLVKTLWMRDWSGCTIYIELTGQVRWDAKRDTVATASSFETAPSRPGLQAEMASGDFSARRIPRFRAPAAGTTVISKHRQEVNCSQRILAHHREYH